MSHSYYYNLKYKTDLTSLTVPTWWWLNSHFLHHCKPDTNSSGGNQWEIRTESGDESWTNGRAVWGPLRAGAACLSSFITCQLVNYTNCNNSKLLLTITQDRTNTRSKCLKCKPDDQLRYLFQLWLHSRVRCKTYNWCACSFRPNSRLAALG